MGKLVVATIAALLLPALALAGGQAMSPVVSSKLKVSNEVPAEGDADGTGFVVVTFSVSKGTACWKSRTSPESPSRRRRTSTRAAALPAPS